MVIKKGNVHRCSVRYMCLKEKCFVKYFLVMFIKMFKLYVILVVVLWLSYEIWWLKSVGKMRVFLWYDKFFRVMVMYRMIKMGVNKFWMLMIVGLFVGELLNFFVWDMGKKKYVMVSVRVGMVRIIYVCC